MVVLLDRRAVRYFYVVDLTGTTNWNSRIHHKAPDCGFRIPFMLDSAHFSSQS
jgi:hypothetical protein